MLITFEVDRHDRLRRAEPLPPRDNASLHGADQNVGHFHLQQEMLGRPVTQHFKPAIDCTASTRMHMLTKVLQQGFFKTQLSVHDLCQYGYHYKFHMCSSC